MNAIHQPQSIVLVLWAQVPVSDWQLFAHDVFSIDENASTVRLLDVPDGS